MLNQSSINKDRAQLSFKNIIDNQLLKNEQIVADPQYSVFVHLQNEEDLLFFIKVLYYWEEMHPSFSTKFPKTVEEYLKSKESANNKKEASTVVAAASAANAAGGGEIK